jgi:hypothetical protein
MAPRGGDKGGRKPVYREIGKETRETLNCRVKPITIAKLKAVKEKLDKSIGQIVDDLVETMPLEWSKHD